MRISPLKFMVIVDYANSIYNNIVGHRVLNFMDYDGGHNINIKYYRQHIKDTNLCIYHHHIWYTFIFIESSYSIVTVSGVYAMSHRQSRERSWSCAEVRPTYAFAYVAPAPDFRRFSPLSCHIDFSKSNLLKTSQISKRYSSSSFCPIKILTCKSCSKFQRK